MAACIVENINQLNVEKIESFLNDSLYKEALESSASFNTRLSIERRMRLPFLDSQTGVAQNHSQLFMSKRQRLPGMLPGQIYSYPRPRWRKKRRQYLLNTRPFHRFEVMDDVDLHSISQMENPALQDNDSKDSHSHLLKDEMAKEWYYDEAAELLEMDPYDEPDQDSDLDYEESYSKRTKKRRGTGRGRSSGGTVDSPGTPGRRKGGGRGRKRASMHNYDPTPGDPDKPFACELCGARYKTRPGLTYHYGHSHKEGASDENSREATTTPLSTGSGAGSAAAQTQPLSQVAPNGSGGGGASGSGSTGPSSPAGGYAPPSSAVAGGQSSPSSNAGAGSDGEASLSASTTSGNNVYQDSYVSFLNHPAGTPGKRGRPGAPGGPSQQAPPTLPPNLPTSAPSQSDDPPMPILVPEKIDAPTASISQMPTTPLLLNGPLGVKPKAAPNPYCDFCLGDTAENKKTAEPEELVSCSDCGRSGHPSCLQFTSNMNISVKKYRWQCIECKCCSVCGTSDNDDQLLFCDDCDRGYHMYCLSPALNAPPEGSWSCKLCIDEFHKP